MPIHAKAPMFLGEGWIAFQECDYGDPKPGELLLRVEANAVCGIDRIQYFGGSKCVPGHEGVGTVIAAGDATTTAIGTRGAIFLMDFCGQYRSCRHGHTNQGSAKRQEMGFTADGGFGPFGPVHESAFFRVPDEVSAVEATSLLDVMGATGHALDSKIIAHQVPRAEIDRAFELFVAGETGKVVVVGDDQ
ncbi:MAG: alcohol dehydrogenase catalytic domain-containing protein [Rhodoglobus sp.]